MTGMRLRLERQFLAGTCRIQNDALPLTIEPPLLVTGRDRCAHLREASGAEPLRCDAMPFLNDTVKPLWLLHPLEATELDRHRRNADQHRFIEGGQLRLCQCPGADE
jgi:hypothetical protein